MKQVSWCYEWIVGLILLFLSLSGNADITSGVSWLQGQVQITGSHGRSTDIAAEFQSTAEALRTYNVIEPANQEIIDLTYQYVNAFDVSGTSEYLSRKIIASVENGQAATATTLIQQLVSLQNIDGGFGEQGGFHSTVIDTVHALNALGIAAYGNNTIIERAISYLLGQQLPNGGFKHSKANEASIYETSVASIALQKFRFNYSLTTAIEGAGSYLLSEQLSDGSWKTTWDSAWSLLALVPVTSDVQSYQAGLAAIRESQSVDGSWGQDVYVTALALRALDVANNIQPPEEVISGVYTGQVKHAETGQFLAGVDVSLSDVAGVSTTSATDGNFKLSGIEPGQHSIVYSAPGFSPVSQNATAVLGQFVSLGTVELTPLPNKSVVFGVVSDAETDQALANVTITVTADAVFTVTTDGGGHFSVEVAPGQIQIAALADGYESSMGTGEVTAGNSLNFSPSLALAGTTPPTETTVTTKATVVDTNTSLPIEGAVISIAGVGVSGATNADGRLVLENIPAGTLDIQISADGYLSTSANTLAPRGSVINLGVVKLQKQEVDYTKRAIRGYVLNAENGEGIGGAIVSIEGTEITVLSNPQGYYFIGDVGQNEAVISSRAVGYLENKGQISFSQLGELSANIELQPAQISKVSISSLQTNLPSYVANTEVEIEAELSNQSDRDRQVRLYVVVANEQREIIQQFPAKQIPLGGSSSDAVETIPSSGLIDVELEWQTGVNAPGAYLIKVQAVDAANGQLLSEKAIQVEVDSITRIGGGASFDPPIVQRVANSEVKLEAIIQNTGNQDISAGSLTATVVLDVPGNELSVSYGEVTQSELDIGSSRKMDIADDGTTYIADINGGTVVQINTDGSTAELFGDWSSISPVDVDIADDGQVYMVTLYGDVFVYNPQTGNSSLLHDPVGVSGVNSIEVLSDGRVWLGAAANGIYEISSDGTVSIVHRVGMSSPYGLVKDSSGALYIPDQQGSVFKYEGGVLSRYLDDGVQSARGIAIDAQDNLYIADFGANQILKVTPSKEMSVFADDISGPWGVNFDASGRLLVASYNGHEVIAVSQDGTKEVLVGQSINNPAHVVYDESGLSYVLDTRGNLVVFDTLAQKELLISTGITLATDLLIESPQEVLILQSSKLYSVSLPSGDRQEIFGGLSGANSIKHAPDGDGYIVVESGGRISRLLTDSTKTLLSEPAFDSPKVIVEGVNGKQFILNTKYITQINSDGSYSRLIEGLSSSRDMVMGVSGKLLVIDGNTRQILEIDGAGSASEIAVLDFYGVQIAQGHDGSLYILQNDQRTIHKRDVNGNIAQLVYSATPIYDLVVAEDGQLWANHRTYNQVSKISTNGSGDIETFSGLPSYPSAMHVASGSGVLITTRVGVQQVSNDGQVTTVLENAYLNNKHFISLSRDADANFWFLKNRNLLVKVDQNGNVIQEYASTYAVNDIELNGSTVFLADSHVLLEVSGFNRVPLLLKTAAYKRLDLLSNSELLLSTSATITHLELASETSTTLVSGISNLTDFSISSTSNQLAVLSSSNNELTYYDDQGVVLNNHVGLVNPKAVLEIVNQQVLVSNSLPNRLMKIDIDGRLSTFSSVPHIQYLANLPDGSISASDNTSLRIYSQDGTNSTFGGSGRITPRSSLVSDGSGGWYAVINTNQLTHLDAAGNHTILASGIGSVRDVEKDSGGEVFILDSSRKSVYLSTDSNSLDLVYSGLSGTDSQALAFSNHDALYIADATSQISVIDTSSSVLTPVIGAPLIAGITGIAISGDVLKAIGNDATGKFIYKATLGNANNNMPAGSVVYTNTIDQSAMFVGEAAVNLDFGSFIPPVSGDYKVSISHNLSDVTGEIINSLHVGGAALGSITLSEGTVFPGSRMVNGSLSITGADSTSVTRLDPDNIVLAASSGATGRAIAADSRGNIYAASSNRIVRVAPDGTVSDFVTGVTVGNGLAVDLNENLYAVSGKNILKITPDGVLSTLATFSTTARAVAVGYDNRIYAVNSNGELVRISEEGVVDILMKGITNPMSLSIDAYGNFYVLTRTNRILRLDPDKQTVAIAYYEPNLAFEYEGVNVIADCSNNLLFAPFRMPSIDFFGEETVIVQVTGNTGEARQIFYGPDVDSALGDMDVLYYDRINDRILVYSDYSNGKVFSFPVSCGGIDVETHIITKSTVDINSFSPAPNRSEPLEDGSVKHVWVMSQVDNQGTSIDFTANFNDMAEGERRAVFKDAYLVFTNSFVEGGQVKTALHIPELLAKSQIDLAVSTDKPSYISREDVQISLPLFNNNDVGFDGKISLEIIDQSGELVEALDDITVSDADPLLETTLSSDWHTGLTLTGEYQVIATLFNDIGLELQTAQTTFTIGHSENSTDSKATLRITTDKLTYSRSEQILFESLSRNVTANVLIPGSKVQVVVTAPDDSEFVSFEHIVGDLTAGNQKLANSVHSLSVAASGSYSVSARLLDQSGNELATSSVSFDVQESATSDLSAVVQVSQASLYTGVPQNCSNTLNNSGTDSLSGLVFRQVLVNLETETEVLFAEQSIESISGLGQHQFVTEIDTSGMASGQYSCLLQLKDGDSWNSLSYAFFKLGEVILEAPVLNATEYPANSVVGISVTVTKLLDLGFIGTIELHVANGAGETIQILSEQSINILSDKQSTNLQDSWSTGTTLAGNYQIVAVLKDDSGQVIQSLGTGFVISVAPLAELQLTVQKPKYFPSEVVIIEAGITSNTLNASLQETVYSVVVTAPDGVVVNTENYPLTELVVDETQLLSHQFTLLDNALDGTYQVAGKVVYQGETLSESYTDFTVELLGAPIINGQVSVSSESVVVGNQQVCTYTLTNDSDTHAATALDIRYQLVSLATNSVLNSQETQIDIAVSGFAEFTNDIETTGLPLGDYSCVLFAQIEGEYKPLAETEFTVVGEQACHIDPSAAEATAVYHSSHNLLVNGSFERHGKLTKGNWGLFKSIPGWEAAPRLEIQQRNQAKHGTNQLELDGDKNGSATQKVATKKGERYQLSLYYSPRITDLGTNTNDVEVFWNNHLLGKLSGDTKGWQYHQFDVVANSKLSAIKLRAAGKSDSYGGLIDQVELICTSCPQLLVNPSFEDDKPAEVKGSGQYSAIPGWAADKTSADFGLTDETSRKQGVVAGDKILDIGATFADTWIVVSQDVLVATDRPLSLALDFTAGVKHQKRGNLDVWWNNERISRLNQNNKRWKRFELDLPPSQSSPAKLSFSSVGVSKSKGYLGGYLDNLSLSCKPEVAQNLVENGSFEEHGKLTAGDWGVFKSIPGWSASPLLEIQSLGYAVDGSNILELDAYNNGKVWQKVKTQPGYSYELAFHYSPRIEKKSTKTNDVDVWWNGKRLTRLSGDRKSWGEYRYSVKATRYSTELRFVAKGPSDSYGGLIDHVSVVQVDPSSLNESSLLISSQPTLVAEAGQPYSYQIVVEGGSDYRFVLDEAPKSASLSKAGLLSWLPEKPGMYKIRLRVIDSCGQTLRQTFMVKVSLPGCE